MKPHRSALTTALALAVSDPRVVHAPRRRVTRIASATLNSREGLNNPPGSTASRELRVTRRERRARRMRLRKLRGWH